jgi:hypothetical protein
MMSENDKTHRLKVLRLKDFAISQGYEIGEELLSILNEQLSLDSNDITPGKLSEFDRALSELTRITFPVTIDTLSSEAESREYKRFKKILFGTGVFTLIVAIIGFCLSVKPPIGISHMLANSILALALGLLGAVVYSLFNVLRIIPPQAFNPSDEYANYARLLLGLLLGWLFYFSFALEAFLQLEGFRVIQDDTKNTFYLLIPFVAGYSTKFVISLLERLISALEITLGVEDKRDASTRRSRISSTKISKH